MPLSASLPIQGPRRESVRIGSLSLDLSFWKLQIGGWLLYAMIPLLLWMTQLVGGGPVLAFAMSRPLTGFLLSTAIRPWCRRLSKRPCPPVVFVTGSALASLGLAMVDYALSAWGLWMAGVIPEFFVASELVVGVFLIRWISMGVWIVLYFGIKQGQWSAVVDQANRESELSLLQAQVHPHFLFNALNSIIAEAKDPEKVRYLTHSLADYLRFSLKQRRLLNSFWEEIHALQSYISIQRIRFGEKLDCRFEVDSEALEHLVPTSIVQPLLENALKYGMRTSPSPLRILVEASVSEGQRLTVSIKNSGQWVPPDATSPGTGLPNLKRRLELIYGGQAEMSVDSKEGAVVVRLSLPAGRS